MSDAAKKLFEGLRSMGEQVQAAAPDLRTLLGQTGAEVKRLGTQGAMELASALFTGQGFVPYGPGQYTPSQSHQQEQQQDLHREAPGRER